MEELKRLRVSVECWFGRQQNLWGIIKGVYRWSKEHFDLDFDITALLTNEHIECAELLATDLNFHLAYLEQRTAESVQHQEEWKEKQQEKRRRRQVREQAGRSVTAMMNSNRSQHRRTHAEIEAEESDFLPTRRARRDEYVLPVAIAMTNGGDDDNEVLESGTLFE